MCISAHSTMVIQRKECGLDKPTTRTLRGYKTMRTLRGYKHRAANIQETYLSYLPYPSTYLPYTSNPTFYPNLSAIFPLSYDAIDAIPWRH